MRAKKWVLLVAALTAALAVCMSASAEEMTAGRIAYSSGGWASHEIKTMNGDGSDVQQLTQLAKDCYEPSWSPDGTRIVFMAYRKFASKSVEICIVNADGSGLTWLTDNNSYDCEPSWSPDGTKILFSSERDNPRGELYLMNPDGTDVVRLTKNTYRESGACFSPDGTKIAFSATITNSFLMYDYKSICVMNADGSEVKSLTNKHYNLVDPAWSPDGSRIAYCTWTDPNNKNANSILLLVEGGVQVMDSNGENPRHIFGTYPSDSSPTWSPDGRQIAFERQDRMLNVEIYVAFPDEEEKDPVNLTKAKSGDGDPDWSKN